MPPTKFCKDCKFMQKQGWFMPISLAVCGHKTAVSFETHYLVDADASKRNYCSMMRLDSMECGSDAKLWEPRR